MVTCGNESRNGQGCGASAEGDFPLCPAVSCFILTEEVGADAPEIRFSRAHGITMVTPASGYAVFMPFVLRLS